MELYPHNELAYSKLKESLVHNQRACVVQPTGTGKSFIVAKFLSENPDKKFLCITSNNYIINQFDKNFKKLFSNYDFVNYPTLISNQFNVLLESHYDYIVFDEFHRAGAEEWGNKLKELLEFYPYAKIIGLTATHIRNDINKDGRVRDMSDELFYGNIVHYLSLREAFDVGILPIPKYIKTLYDLRNEYDKVINKINKSNVKNKSLLKKYALEKKLEWEKSKGADKILKKHISSERNFIVFCKNIVHLESLLETVEGWFKSAFKKPVNSFKIYSSYLDSKDELNAFQIKSKKRNNEFNLLFSVQQLNEGLHINNIDGVLFLRPTESHIIYYQQLGRCLETKGKRPLVFDMVNNFRATSKQHDIFYQKYQPTLREAYVKADYKNFIFEFKIIDEIEDYRNLFSDIEIKLSSWYKYYSEFRDVFYSKDYEKLSDNSSLTRWWTTQKYQQKDTDKINLLDGLNNIIGVKWNENISTNTIKSYLEINKIFESNDFDVLAYYLLSKKQRKWLLKRINTKAIKSIYKHEATILKDLLETLLNKIGIDIKLVGKYNFDAVIKYLSIKRKLLNGVYDSDVSSYLANKRRDYKLGRLNGFEIYLNELNSLLGHNWLEAKLDNKRTWEDVFKKINDSLNKGLFIEMTYRKWIVTQRSKFRNDKLTKNQIEKLNQLNIHLGYDWKVGKYAK